MVVARRMPVSVKLSVTLIWPNYISILHPCGMRGGWINLEVIPNVRRDQWPREGAVHGDGTVGNVRKGEVGERILRLTSECSHQEKDPRSQRSERSRQWQHAPSKSMRA